MTTSSEFLVTHGVAAALTRCRDVTAILPRRGDRVVFRGPRGLEIGEVLCPASTPSEAAAAGELVRPASTDDEVQADLIARRANALLDDVQARIAETALPLLALDVEIPLDGSRAFVHVLRWDACSLTTLLEALHQTHGIPISFQDRGKADEPAPADDHDHGCESCGSGGCGSGGCGSCSSGSCGTESCSSGAVKSAEELTAYFANLREQMWHAQERVPLA